jgi:NAD(P)-dependent dehydrogenase (short-subunit alcohol dehydrogenase family)
MGSMDRSPIALVTGASRGIGRAIARLLAERGWRVCLTARDAATLTEAREALGEATTAAVAADLRDPAAPARILAECERQLGPVTALINNAGTAPSAKIEHTTDALIDEALDLHVRAPLRLVRAAIGGMRAAGGGCIVQIASSAGLRGYPFTAAYTAAKHGMVGLARALAVELRGEPIRVYAVCPGFVDTELTRRAAAAIAERGRQSESEALARLGAMNAGGRLLRADEVAGVVADLCDPATAPPSGAIYDLETLPPVAVEGQPLPMRGPR